MKKLLGILAVVALLAVPVMAQQGVYEGVGGTAANCTGSAAVTLTVMSSMRVKLSTYTLALPFNGVQSDLTLTCYGTLGTGETANVDAQYEMTTAFASAASTAAWWFKIDAIEAAPGHVHWALTNVAGEKSTTFRVGTYAQGDATMVKTMKVCAMPGSGTWAAHDTSTGTLTFTMCVN